MRWSLRWRATRNQIPRMLVDRVRWETRIRKRPLCLMGDIPGDRRMCHLLGWRGSFWTHAGIQHLSGPLDGSFPVRLPRGPGVWYVCAHWRVVWSKEVRLNRMPGWMPLYSLREVRARRVSSVAWRYCGPKVRFGSRILRLRQNGNERLLDTLIESTKNEKISKGLKPEHGRLATEQVPTRS